MKKAKLLIILLGIIFLTGCVKYDLGNTVGPNKEFTLTLVNGMLNEYYNKENLTESIEEYKKLGYEVEDYFDSKYSGLKLTKQYKTIDDVSTATLGQVGLIDILEIDTKDIKLFKVEKNGTISKYTANLIYDLTLELSEQGKPEDYSEYSETMYFGYHITIPTNAKIISHNADKTEENDHILSWEIEYGTKKIISFVFEIDDSKEGTEIIKQEESSNVNIDNSTSEINGSNHGENNPKKQTNPISLILSILIMVGAIVGIIYFKKKSFFKKKKKMNDPTILYHEAPPKR